MNDRFPSGPRWDGNEWCKFEALSPETELRHVRNVSSRLLREALVKWAELWSEFQQQVLAGFMVLPDAQRGFTPRCGWPEFLENMWQMKLYLDSAKRFCERRP